MQEYHANISWQRGEQVFSDNQYSRAHLWQFDGGLSVAASSSPQTVLPPLSVNENIDPEEALVAALSSCHMLFFLAFARKQGYVVDHYRDAAVGILDKNELGKTAITRVTLRPHAGFSGAAQPNAGQLQALHHLAHDHCYIANSLRAEVVIEPT